MKASHKKIAIVYHSANGHTARQAQAVAAGVYEQPDTSCKLIAIDAAGEITPGDWEDLLAADAIVFGSPTFMGSVSWQFKKFADATSKPWFEERWKNKLAAGFTNSSSMNGEKLAALYCMFTLAMQHGMLWVGTGLLPANLLASSRDDLNYLGSACGAMAQSPADSSVEQGPLPGDLDTARVFGRRIAECAGRIRF